MNNIIKLPESYEDCPEWWQKFVYNTHYTSGRSEREQILKKYNASVVRTASGNVDYIEFKIEEYKTWFLLNIQIDENFK